MRLNEEFHLWLVLLTFVLWKKKYTCNSSRVSKDIHQCQSITSQITILKNLIKLMPYTFFKLLLYVNDFRENIWDKAAT